MRTLTNSKSAVALAAGLTVVGALAGCSSTAADPTPTTDPGTTETTTPSPSASSDPGAAAGTYNDGSYTESGSYQSPGGTESVAVTITLAADVITDVSIVGTTTDAQAKAYQGEFIAGIAAEVVGKKIDEISVDKVGGSSLTSGGFNDAVELIKADAAA